MEIYQGRSIGRCYEIHTTTFHLSNVTSFPETKSVYIVSQYSQQNYTSYIYYKVLTISFLQMDVQVLQIIEMVTKD